MTRRRPKAIGAAIVAMLLLVGCGPELGPVSRLGSIPAPRLPETSDPSVVRVGREYFVYGSNNHLRAPVTRLGDIDRTLTLAEKNRFTHEGMPTKPAWTARANQLWAPTVGKFGNRWIMYFSADRPDPPQRNNPQCLGRAFATSPAGPFTPEAKPWHCGLNARGGALDPQLFTDPQGRHWLHAAFGDTESPIHAIRLDANGNRVGDAQAILKRQHAWEYHFIEQPAMIYDGHRKNYVLTYSAGRWWEGRYSIGVARCSTPSGPCTSDPSGPWVASSAGRSGPGALSFFSDTTGTARAIFSSFRAGSETTVGGRSASVMKFGVLPSVSLHRVGQ
jgi:beta-xylosidase